MSRERRPYRSASTAVLANYILSNLNEAVDVRNNFDSEDGFSGVGKAFAETVKCECTKAEDIAWDQIDETIQYDVLSAIKISQEVEPEVEETEKVLEAELPEKTLEVADKVDDPIDDVQDGEDTSDIEDDSN
jgi:hypothetical protein